MEGDSQAGIPAPDHGDHGDHGERERPKPSRRTLVLLVAPIVVLTIAGTIATALFPYLSSKHPLLLILLDARNRMLVVAREVHIVPFVVIALLRRTLSDPLFYLLGRFYGHNAIHWLEKKGGFGPLVPLTQKLFAKAGYPMVFLFPGALVCALAGTTGMSLSGFMVANVAGTITSILLVRAFSGVVASPVDSLLGFFERNLLVTTLVSVGLVLLSLLLNKVQGKLETPSLDELETELEKPELEGSQPSDPQPGGAQSGGAQSGGAQSGEAS